jgi:hypothetical protein
MICTAHQILTDQIKKNEIGWACSTYGAQARCIKDFGDETLRKDTFLIPLITGTIILK